MQRIRKLLRMLKKKIKQKLHIPDKPFIDLIALHLLDIARYLLLIFGTVIFFALICLILAISAEEARQVFIISMIFDFALLGFAFALCLGSGSKIIPKIEKFDSLTKYKFLMIRASTFRLMYVLLLVMVPFIPLTVSPDFLIQTIGELFTWKLLYFLMSFVIGLFGIAFGFSYLSISDERVTAMNFELFEDFENLGEYYNQQFLGIAKSQALSLKTLMKRIVYQTEKAVNQCLDICKDFPTDFYRPFTTISITSILGNTEQNRKAKTWVRELGNIVMEKRISDSAKVKFVLKHLEKVQNDNSLKEFRTIQDTFGFQYSFEHSRKRLSKTGEKVVLIISGISGIVTIILFFITLLGLL